ncbi:synaptic vesicle glycoprotein 2B [Aethina tumida]|uniref:synaptic vesicle glycoprotein 2B n=1 Tax=Aethina tumida TaxID=116153 RepID=UPI00096B5A3B|nr:synaptic vesicle glycoprotein 2B [Aethina tumida]XP_049820697.1 synaptic vesicle glycoprotein 2B [Aethina tumida]
MTVSSRKMSVKKEQNDKNQENNGSTFEEAVEATGFGKFNFLMISLIVPSAWAIQFETSNMSYVFPVAQCDLNLTMNHKGFLNAATYAGMLVGCFVWGILTDKFGRKRVLTCGYSLNFIVALMCVLTQNFIMILTLKIISGFLINGPSNALAAYISEVHTTKYRSRMQMFLGFTYGAGNICLPAIASLILPQDIHFTLFNGYFVFHSWNLFILASASASLSAAIGLLFMPESPKYYMSKGDNEKALKVFRYMYRLNTGNPKDSFPITKLTQENPTIKEEVTDQEGQSNSILLIFKPPYLKNLLILCVMNFSLVTSVNTLRLWMPQILQGIHEYQLAHNGSSTSFCEVMKDMNSVEQEDLVNCIVNSNDNQDVYFKSMIIGAVAMISYSVAIVTVNHFEKRRLIAILGAIAGTIITCVFLSQDTPTILGLVSSGLAMINVSIDVMITILVVIFPTSMRGTALSLSSMFGRSGSLVGNILFPVLLKTGCKPPFFLLGSIIVGSTLMGLLLPRISSKTIA